MNRQKILIGLLVVGVLAGSVLLFRSASATNYQTVNIYATTVSETQINITCSGAPSGYADVYRNGSYIGYFHCGNQFTDTGRACGTSYSYMAYDDSDYDYYSSTINGSSGACTPPSISYSPPSRSWSNTSVTVTVNASDPAGMNASSLCSCVTTSAAGSCDPGNPTQILSCGSPPETWNITGEGSYITCSRGVDTLGNVTPSPGVCSGAYQKDVTGPTAPTLTPSTLWTNASSINITFSGSTDALSGVASYESCWVMDLPGCTPSVIGSSLTLSGSNSLWTVCANATDVAGNTGATTCSNFHAYETDQIAPTPNPETISGVAQSASLIHWTLGTGSDAGGVGLSATPYGISGDNVNYSWISSNTWDQATVCGTAYTIYGKLRDGVGNMTSAGSATVTTPACNQPPTVNTVSCSVNEGQDCSFTANGSDPNSDPLTYYWYANSTNCNAHTSQLGTGSTYDAGTQGEPTTASYYYAAYDGSLWSTSCAPANASWADLPPNITNTTNGSGNENTSVNVSFTAADPGGGALTYKWFQNSDCSGEIGGAVSNTYSAPAQPEPTSITYYGRAYDAQGAGTGCAAAPANASWTNVAPTVSVSNNAPVACGSAATFTAAGSDPGGTTFSYQWYSDACTTPISGATGSTRGETVGYGGSVTRYAKVWDAQSLSSSCSAASTATSCTDNTAPTISSVTASSPSCQTVRFTVNGASDPYSGLHSSAPYSFNGGSSWQANNYADFSGTSYTLTAGNIKVRDNAGNIYTYGSDASGTASSCNTAPYTPTSLSPANNTWVNSHVFCATVSDPDGGNVTGHFVIGGSDYTGSTVTSGSQSCYTYGSDTPMGGTSWYVYAKDPSNAVSGNTTTLTAKIDTAAPTPGATWTPSSGTWHNTSTGTTFTLTGSTDALSGMAAASYQCTTAGTNGATCTVTVYDVAGNSAVSAASPPNPVDLTAPSCGSTWTPSSGTWHNTLTGTSFTLTGSTDTGGSGISAGSYNCTTAGTNGATCNATIGDNAGNTVSCGPSPTNNVDQTNPTTSALSANPSGWTNGGSATITGTVSDAGGSGVAGYYHKCTSGGSYTYSAGSSISFSCSTTGGQTAYVYGTDNAGNNNSGSPSSVSYYIDTSAPTASITGNSVNEGSAMTLNSNGADTGGSGVASYAWYQGTICSGTVLGSSATFPAGTQNEPTSGGYISVNVTDGAGNSTCVNALITWNNVAPTASASVSPNPICNGSSTTWTAVGSDPGGTTFSYQWYSDGSCSASIGGATNLTLVDTGTYPSTARSVIVKDAQSAAASCAPATVTVNTCVAAPPTPAPSTNLDSGRPRVSFSWSSNASGYQIWRYALGAPSSTRSLYIDTTNSSATISSLLCPAGYTFEFVAYNADVSVSGVDSSCALWGISGSKCSVSSVANTKVDFCTKLFLNQ